MGLAELGIFKGILLDSHGLVGLSLEKAINLLHTQSPP